jgi:riboflavin kinase/FMN adenylyltransferase
MSDPRATSIDELPDVGDAAVCMGVFDGVHRGHVALIQATAQAARERGARAVVLVFDPHPDEVVRPGTQVARLAPLHENIRRLEAAGVDNAVPLRFDTALRALTAEQFLQALAPAIRVRALLMTPESAFGRDRAGTPDALRGLGRGAGFELITLERLAADGPEPISSGRIRRALAAGEMDEATRLLGHPAYLEGAIRSDGRQAPLQFDYHPALPAPGEYRARIRDTNAPVEIDDVLVRIGPEARVELFLNAPMSVDRVALDLFPGP